MEKRTTEKIIVFVYSSGTSPSIVNACFPPFFDMLNVNKFVVKFPFPVCFIALNKFCFKLYAKAMQISISSANASAQVEDVVVEYYEN